MNVYQIQMVNGQEVIANILEWQPEDNIKANNILEMVPLEMPADYDLDETKSYYILKPWVTYTDSLGKETSINPGAVMCVTEPSKTILNQYYSSLKEIIESMKDELVSSRETQGNVVSFTPKSSPTLLKE
jgi:hypothetical protein